LENEDLKEQKVIGSVEELVNEIQKSIDAGFMTENPFKDFEIGNMSAENYAKIDLHKNIVDAITLVSDSGKPMKRESDLIDVWFDSGSMPYAQLHYPFENKEMIDSGKAFLQILLQKELTKLEVGFIHFTQLELRFLILLLIKMWFLTV
jgi:isoleucyl-tRNA synthetase